MDSQFGLSRKTHSYIHSQMNTEHTMNILITILILLAEYNFLEDSLKNGLVEITHFQFFKFTMYTIVSVSGITKRFLHLIST